MTSRIDAVLDAARARLRRLHADDVPGALERGALLVDIRPQAQRDREGDVPAALVIERNVLEWRCDPTSDARLPQAVGRRRRVGGAVLGGLHLQPGRGVAARPRPAPGDRRRRRVPRAEG